MPASTLDALLTKRYGQWKRPIADPDTFTASLPFVPSSDKSGKDFSMPILTAISQGVTSDNTGGVVTLNGARSGQNSQATLDGVNLYIQEQLSYSDLMKMGNGDSMDGSAGAYESGPDWVMYSMLLGLKHASEIMSLYGSGTNSTLSTGGDIGVIAALVAGTNIGAGGPATITITAATWAKLLWLNSGSGGSATSGMLVDIIDTTGVTVRTTKVQVQGVVDSTKCQVKLLSTAGSSVPNYVPVAGDRLVPTGFKASSAVGMSSILQTVGSFAGIDNTSIPQWRPQSYDCGATAITTDHLQAFAGKLLGNGFKKGEFDVWSAPPVNSVLINQFTPYAQWINGAGADKKNIGAGALAVDTPVGRLNLRPYGYIKQGEILVIAKGEAVRIGASEKRTDGIQGSGLALELQGQSGSEMRAMCQFAPLLTTPFYSGRMSNFTTTDKAFDQPAA